MQARKRTRRPQTAAGQPAAASAATRGGHPSLASRRTSQRVRGAEQAGCIVGAGHALATLAQGRIGHHHRRPWRELEPWRARPPAPRAASARPAPAPTIAAPSIRPRLPATTLTTPSVCRSARARSLSANGQRSTSWRMPLVRAARLAQADRRRARGRCRSPAGSHARWPAPAAGTARSGSRCRRGSWPAWVNCMPPATSPMAKTRALVVRSRRSTRTPLASCGNAGRCRGRDPSIVGLRPAATSRCVPASRCGPPRRPARSTGPGSIGCDLDPLMQAHALRRAAGGARSRSSSGSSCGRIGPQVDQVDLRRRGGGKPAPARSRSGRRRAPAILRGSSVQVEYRLVGQDGAASRARGSAAWPGGCRWR